MIGSPAVYDLQSTVNLIFLIYSFRNGRCLLAELRAGKNTKATEWLKVRILQNNSYPAVNKEKKKPR